MKYTPVRVSTIKSVSAITFDLHLFFKDTYVVYLKKGSSLPDEKIKKLKKQKVGKFFISSEEEKSYQDYLDNLLSQIISDPNASAQDKAEVVGGACKNAVEGMRSDPNSKEAYQATTNASKSICQVVLQNPDTLKEMYKIESDDDVILQSSLNTSALVIRMAHLKGLDNSILENMSTGCLLRDIGIVGMDEKYHRLFGVPLEEYTPIELKIYKTHPELGKKILEERGDVPPDVIEYVYTHEVKLQGNGFPKDILKLTPEQTIISLCSAYDRLVTCLKKTPKEAVQSLSIDELGNYDLEDIKFLKKMLKDDGLI